MQLILQYTGSLPGRGTPTQKQEIRSCFHPQLKELWNSEPALKQRLKHMKDGIRFDADQSHAFRASSDHDLILANIPPAKPRDVGRLKFLPLVEKEMSMGCYLEIVIKQRSSIPVVQHGDIDNRLKTLFDALKMPQEPGELAESAVIPHGDEFMFVLLDDDSRITGLKITTEKWLAPIDDHKTAKHVQLEIIATVRPTEVTLRNLAYLGGFFI